MRSRSCNVLQLRSGSDVISFYRKLMRCVANHAMQKLTWGCGGSDGDVVAQRGCGGSDGDVVAQTGMWWLRRGCGGSAGMWWLSGDVVAQRGCGGSVWGCGGSVG
jgi:hypothetical protein